MRYWCLQKDLTVRCPPKSSFPENIKTWKECHRVMWMRKYWRRNWKQTTCQLWNYICPWSQLRIQGAYLRPMITNTRRYWRMWHGRICTKLCKYWYIFGLKLIQEMHILKLKELVDPSKTFQKISTIQMKARKITDDTISD